MTMFSSAKRLQNSKTDTQLTNNDRQKFRIKTVKAGR